MLQELGPGAIYIKYLGYEEYEVRETSDIIHHLEPVDPKLPEWLDCESRELVKFELRLIRKNIQQSLTTVMGKTHLVNLSCVGHQCTLDVINRCGYQILGPNWNERIINQVGDLCKVKMDTFQLRYVQPRVTDTFTVADGNIKRSKTLGLPHISIKFFRLDTKLDLNNNI